MDMVEDGSANGVEMVLTLGEQRRAARLAAGMTLQQVAARDGVTRQAISQREQAIAGVGKRGPGKARLALVESVRELATSGLNRTQIAEIVGRSYSCISELAIQHGIEVARKSGSGRPRTRSM